MPEVICEAIDPIKAVSEIKSYLLALQNEICQALEEVDGEAKFEEDKWKSPHGSGITRTIASSAVIEKGGVNFSLVHGSALPIAATQKRNELHGASYEALGISLVIHPKNPFIPTSHANIRFIVTHKPNADPIWWFGGGYDLTPYYGFKEDAQHWHRSAKDACSPFGEQVYPKFKKWCDDYFYLKHRNEPRGIGGLFFDDLNQWPFADCFAFMQSIGNSFLTAYIPIIKRRKDYPYGERERNFQNYRRARYVEFNLIYDRGTLFGLQSGGRTESILMSLPPIASWQYNWQPESGTPEAQLYEQFLTPKDWAAS